jgi:hypothetical protein
MTDHSAVTYIVPPGPTLNRPGDQVRKLVTVGGEDLLAFQFPPRETLLHPWLQSQSLSMLYAWRGVGKTHTALGIAWAVASGGEFLGWSATKPAPVLYLDGEMPGAALQERLRAIHGAAEKQPPPGSLRFITPDLQPEGLMPNLATSEGQTEINAALGDAALIVVDNLSCLARGGVENDAESWSFIANWALQMRAAGRAVLFIHHAGKGGAQRGTSKREDLLDTVISLRRPTDYTPDQGARFAVHFEKARALFGQDVEPFEAALETDATGRQRWTLTASEEAGEAKMIELANLGLSQTDIARELGCHKSTVCRTLQGAQAEGRYKPVRRGASKDSAP